MECLYNRTYIYILQQSDYYNNIQLYKFDNCIVNSINFPDQKWQSASGQGKCLYEIDIKSYEKDYFTVQGIIEPSDEWQIDESEDGTIKVTHTVSARGVNKNNTTDAFDSAVSWCTSRMGWNNVPSPTLGGIPQGVDPSMIDRSENINRLEATYSVTEVFEYSRDNPSVSQVITTRINQSISSDFTEVSADGEWKYGFNNMPANGLESLVQEGLAALFTQAQAVAGFTTLNSEPLNFSSDIDNSAKTISISASWDDNNLFGNHKTYFDYSTNVKHDLVTDTIEIGIQGEMKTRGGDLQTRISYLNDVMGWIEGGFGFTVGPRIGQVTGGGSGKGYERYLYLIAEDIYRNSLGGKYALCPLPTSKDFSFDERRATLRYNGTFTDKDWMTGASDAGWSVSVNAPFRTFRPHADAVTMGRYGVQDLGIYSNELVSMAVNVAVPLGDHNNIDSQDIFDEEVLANNTLNRLTLAVTTGGGAPANPSPWGWMYKQQSQKHGREGLSSLNLGGKYNIERTILFHGQSNPGRVIISLP